MPAHPALRPAGRAVAALILTLALASLVLQYLLLLRQAEAAGGAVIATLRFFGYFTILSNVLVAATTAAAARDSKGFFAQPRVRAGVALYIAVTGLIYFLILRHLWQPQGAQWWADTGLHYAVPLAYVAWWLIAVPHGGLRGSDLWRWLFFPLVYLGWALTLGAVLGQYPYPFIDLAQLGWARTLLNALGVLCVFVALGGILLALDQRLRRHPR